uniref:Uncharacterized protein n=1 Tax=viral metagenome TaxID=1070528 RepID=A0A6C0JT25_9ZZZZ
MGDRRFGRYLDGDFIKCDPMNRRGFPRMQNPYLQNAWCNKIVTPLSNRALLGRNPMMNSYSLNQPCQPFYKDPCYDPCMPRFRGVNPCYDPCDPCGPFGAGKYGVGGRYGNYGIARSTNPNFSGGGSSSSGQSLKDLLEDSEWNKFIVPFPNNEKSYLGEIHTTFKKYEDDIKKDQVTVDSDTAGDNLKCSAKIRIESTKKLQELEERKFHAVVGANNCSGLVSNTSYSPSVNSKYRGGNGGGYCDEYGNWVNYGGRGGLIDNFNQYLYCSGDYPNGSRDLLDMGDCRFVFDKILEEYSEDELRCFLGMRGVPFCDTMTKKQLENYIKYYKIGIPDCDFPCVDDPCNAFQNICYGDEYDKVLNEGFTSSELKKALHEYGVYGVGEKGKKELIEMVRRNNILLTPKRSHHGSRRGSRRSSRRGSRRSSRRRSKRSGKRPSPSELNRLIGMFGNRAYSRKRSGYRTSRAKSRRKRSSPKNSRNSTMMKRNRGRGGSKKKYSKKRYSKKG